MFTTSRDTTYSSQGRYTVTLHGVGMVAWYPALYQADAYILGRCGEPLPEESWWTPERAALTRDAYQDGIDDANADTDALNR